MIRIECAKTMERAEAHTVTADPFQNVFIQRISDSFPFASLCSFSSLTVFQVHPPRDIMRIPAHVELAMWSHVSLWLVLTYEVQRHVRWHGTANHRYWQLHWFVLLDCRTIISANSGIKWSTFLNVKTLESFHIFELSRS